MESAVYDGVLSTSKVFEVLVCLFPSDSAPQCQIYPKLWTQKDFILHLDISHHNKSKERKEGDEEEIKQEGRKEGQTNRLKDACAHACKHRC